MVIVGLLPPSLGVLVLHVLHYDHGVQRVHRVGATRVGGGVGGGGGGEGEAEVVTEDGGRGVGAVSDRKEVI